MNNYKLISLLLLVLVFLVGCGKPEDFAKRKVLVYEFPSIDLVVVSVEGIPKTNLSRIVVAREDGAKFSLVASKSSGSGKLGQGERVDVVEVRYFENNAGVARIFYALKEKE